MKAMQRVWTKTTGVATLAALGLLIVGTGVAAAAETGADPSVTVLRDRKIGYVLTHRLWSVIQTPDAKTECPQGMNTGPREQFQVLFPNDGKKRTVMETQLKREGEQWLFTKDVPNPFPYLEAQGKTSYGMNLDGKVKPTDFTSPDGEPGIDNQMFRASGCIANFRGPSVHPLWWYENEYVRRYVANRFMIEISDLDSLENDDDVTIKSYRGMDELLIDAVGDETGQVITPGGTQRIDQRWGKFAQSTWKGKIVNGTLISEPSDVVLPAFGRYLTTAVVPIKGARFQLKLTPQRANGVIAGYADIEGFQKYLNASWPQHYHSNGEMPTISFFHAIDRLADGYPDAAGHNTAISASWTVRMTQVYIVPPEQTKPERPLASNAAGSAQTPAEE
jgi:hypothetical protein